VKSPGLPIPPITIDKLKAFNVTSYRRNPHIAEAFKAMAWIDEQGWGLKNMRQWLYDNKLPEPLFNIEDHYLVVTFLGREHTEVKALRGDMKDIYLFIKDKKKATTKEIQEQFELSERNAQRYLKELAGKQFIEKVGERGPGVYFRVLEKKER